MPPRISLLAPRRIAFRPRCIAPSKSFSHPQSRFASNDASGPPVQENPGQPPSGANESQLPHVSEEQAAMDKITGEEPVEIDQHGTPVQEIMKRDKDFQENAPEVLKQEMNTGQKRSYSTSARRLSEGGLESSSGGLDAMPPSMLQSVQFDGTRANGLQYPDAGLGHKFPLPDMGNWKNTDHLRRRYDPVVYQVTKAIMRDGKLSVAQKNMSTILDVLRTAPPPQPNVQNASRNLITDTQIETDKTNSPWMKRDALPLSPIQYLTSAIDSVAPLIKIRQQRGVLGGGQALQLPVPLRIQQRRRTAIKWILQSAQSGKDAKLADRVAREIIKVATGQSTAWEKRQAVHKLAVVARSNIRLTGGRRRF